MLLGRGSSRGFSGDGFMDEGVEVPGVFSEKWETVLFMIYHSYHSCSHLRSHSAHSISTHRVENSKLI